MPPTDRTKRCNRDELREELERFEQVLEEANLRENTVRTYVDRTKLFLRWLDGDYEPDGPVG